MIDFRKKPLLGLLMLMVSGSALASHLTYFGTIDAINFDFGSGTGSHTGALSASDDDDWLTFSAVAGETIELRYTALNDTFRNFAVFRDENDNGVIEVGDEADILGFSGDQSGQGTDLVVQHAGFVEGDCETPGTGSYCVGSGVAFVPHTFVAPVTGQYVVGISSSNDEQGVDYTVEIVGREGGVPAAPVPVDGPIALWLLVFLTAGIGLLAARRSHAS